MTADVVEGGCLCGTVRYRVTGRALAQLICHCRTCRRASGAPSVAWVTFRSTDFAFVVGGPASFRSSPPVTRTFCGNCGTPLTYRHQSSADTVDVTTVTLDSPDELAPTCEVWTEHKVGWESLDEALPHYPRGAVSS
jgi:hypothetical protein